MENAEDSGQELREDMSVIKVFDLTNASQFTVEMKAVLKPSLVSK